MFIKDYFFYTEIFILGNSLIIEGQMQLVFQCQNY